MNPDNEKAELLLRHFREAAHVPEATYLLSDYLATVRDRPIDAGPELDGHGHPTADFALLYLMGVPVDRPRDKLSDRVPYTPKTLAKRTRSLLSVSREYHEGVKNPLLDPPGRNWFGMSTAERKHLVRMEKTTGYFVNREEEQPK